jgi:hypothetical protein
VQLISKIQASKLPTVPESQAPIDNGQFRKRPNSIAVFGPPAAWGSGTVGSLEACIFEIIALNQKKSFELIN